LAAQGLRDGDALGWPMMSLQPTYPGCTSFNKIEDSIQAIHMIRLYERKGEFPIQVFRKPCGLLAYLVLYPSVVFVSPRPPRRNYRFRVAMGGASTRGAVAQTRDKGHIGVDVAANEAWNQGCPRNPGTFVTPDSTLQLVTPCVPTTFATG